MTTMKSLASLSLLMFALRIEPGAVEPSSSAVAGTHLKSIREFGVLPTNTAAINKEKLQKAIDWAHRRGAALFVEPSDDPYPVASGVILRANASLIGVHGPVGRGTRHPEKIQPVDVTCAQVIQHTHVMPLPNQTVDQCRAQEARSTGDQKLHVFPLYVDSIESAGIIAQPQMPVNCSSPLQPLHGHKTERCRCF